MQLTYVSLRNSWFFALGSVAFAACGGGADSTTTSGSSVDAAYAALVSDVAQCGKQVDSCLTSAGTDNAALEQCRTQFTTCRDSAGAKAESRVATAVTGCTSKHRECAKAAHGADGSVKACQDDLGMCLHAAKPARADDDADAGSDESAASSGSGKNKDCLEDLRSCVESDGKPAECAQELRSCVVSALPSVDVVAPKRSDDSAQKPADMGKPADAGSSGKERSGEARKCMTSFSGCIEAGGAPQSCLSALKDCKSVFEP